MRVHLYCIALDGPYCWAWLEPGAEMVYFRQSLRRRPDGRLISTKTREYVSPDTITCEECAEKAQEWLMLIRNHPIDMTAEGAD